MLMQCRLVTGVGVEALSVLPQMTRYQTAGRHFDCLQHCIYAQIVVEAALGLPHVAVSSQQT